MYLCSVCGCDPCDRSIHQFVEQREENEALRKAHAALFPNRKQRRAMSRGMRRRERRERRPGKEAVEQ